MLKLELFCWILFTSLFILFIFSFNKFEFIIFDIINSFFSSGFSFSLFSNDFLWLSFIDSFWLLLLLLSTLISILISFSFSFSFTSSCSLLLSLKSSLEAKRELALGKILSWIFLFELLILLSSFLFSDLFLFSSKFVFGNSSLIISENTIFSFSLLSLLSLFLSSSTKRLVFLFFSSLILIPPGKIGVDFVFFSTFKFWEIVLLSLIKFNPGNKPDLISPSVFPLLLSVWVKKGFLLSLVEIGLTLISFALILSKKKASFLGILAKGEEMLLSLFFILIVINGLKELSFVSMFSFDSILLLFSLIELMIFWGSLGLKGFTPLFNDCIWLLLILFKFEFSFDKSGLRALNTLIGFVWVFFAESAL